MFLPVALKIGGGLQGVGRQQIIVVGTVLPGDGGVVVGEGGTNQLEVGTLKEDSVIVFIRRRWYNN